MKLLIFYGTSEGQTRKIAAFIADRFRNRSADVTVVDSASMGRGLQPRDFDAAIIAARVHAGTFPRPLVRFVRVQAKALSAMPSAFVPVSMMAARPDDASRKASAHYVRRFLENTSWTPRMVHHAAGARRYSQHGAVERWILRTVDKFAGFPADTSHDYEWTDWEALAKFANAFLDKCEPSSAVRPTPVSG